ncbi:hypothetical protein EZV62_013985 [Acer yangbiense]|uniref:Uncharacterized protein n=1 Tax=Acer yangbiense TaxID=1000413 RepID=A0A5C7HT97_9ROSI|nr:hypothetical protein EZV62_013985 [Acer yangbiense]
MAGERDVEEAGLKWVGPPHSSHTVKFPKEGPCIIRRRRNIVTEDISKLFVKRQVEPSSQ